MLRRVFAWLPAVLLAALPCVSFAQDTTGRLEGRVLDAKGAPIPEVNVTVTSPALQGGRGCLTDPHGAFVLLSLPVGEYRVKLAHLAHQAQVFDAVRVGLGQTTTLGDVRMPERVLDQPEVVVTAERPLIDPKSTEAGGVLESRDFSALPIERDYRSTAALLPHANTSAFGDPVNFAGSTGLENRYFVDGIDVSDSYRGASGTRLPYNFIRQVQVRTAGYSAEYRGSLGGAVNAVTYSGGNEFAGHVIGFFTGNGLSATPRSIPGESGNQDYLLSDVGFGLGGPIRKDRLWYYVAYNPSLSSEDVLIPGFGTYEDRNTTHSFAGKLTWRADERNTIVFTTVGDPSEGRSITSPWGGAIAAQPGNIDPFVYDVQAGGVSEVLDWRYIPRQNLVIETSLSYMRTRDNNNPGTERGRTEPLFNDSTSALSGGGAPTVWKNESEVVTATVLAKWAGTSQDLVWGVSYRDVGLEFENEYNNIIQSGAADYSTVNTRMAGNVGARVPSAFLQHTWRPAERWVVSEGLRWDGQYWIDSEGGVAQTILDEWQPRLGLTYLPGKTGTRKVYASAGRFYQDLLTTPILWYYNAGSSYLIRFFDHDPRVDPSGADTISYFSGAIQPKVDGLKGQHYDEFTLGYEQQLGIRARVAVRGIHRVLRRAIEDASDPSTGIFVLGNPGYDALSEFPRAERTYSALEFSFQGRIGRNLSLLGSYVLSRNRGNYTGFLEITEGGAGPNVNTAFDVIEKMRNATGLLPNDHTHVFKLSGIWGSARGLTVGATGVVQSGMPLSEYGGTTVPPYYGFIGTRGSHGRTPTVWNLDLRFGYEPPFMSKGRFQPTLTLDVLHVASQRQPVQLDEVHYFSLDESGNQANPNPNYLSPKIYQRPMAVRLGLEMGF